MRSDNLFYNLLVLWFFLILLGMPVTADPESHQPTLIIPTKFRYLLADMVQSPDGSPVPAPAQTPAPATVSADNAPVAEQTDDSGMDEEALLAALAPDPSYSGYGRGFVQTNFDVNFESAGQKIDNRERLTARGLFDIHVVHGLN